METTAKVDVVIVGMGMIGMTMALGLLKQGKRVVIIDSQFSDSVVALDIDAPFDLRVSALSLSSITLLTKLNAWQYLPIQRCCDFSILEGWQDPNHRLTFSSKISQKDKLGIIVENKMVQYALWQALNKYIVRQDPKLLTYYPDQLIEINRLDQTEHGFYQLSLKSGIQLQCDLVVAADGAQSQIRKLTSIGLTSWDYGQRCLLVNIKYESSSSSVGSSFNGDNERLFHRTWQQFTPKGPRAFLPFSSLSLNSSSLDSSTVHYASLVWYDDSMRIKQLQQLSLLELAQQIKITFPPLLDNNIGHFEVIECDSFPLTRRHIQKYYQDQIVFVGDAAHTIHPLAGQGANLGFRDAKALLDILEKKENLSHLSSYLAKYQQQRYKDNLLMQSAMDLLHFGFNNNNPFVHLFTGVLFKGIKNLSLLKKVMQTYALGN